MAWENLIPGPGWVVGLPSLLGKIVGDRDQQATEQTQAEYFAEQAYSNPEALWDEPFGQSAPAPVTSIAPPPLAPSPSPLPLPPTGGAGPSFPPSPTPSLPAPSAPPPAPVPTPTPPPTGTTPAPSGPASGGWSYETYERAVDRMRRDTAVRRGAPGPRTIDMPQSPGWGVVLRGLGGWAAGIGGLLWPSPVGTGVLTPEEEREAIERGRLEAERESAQLERALEELAEARARAWPMPPPLPPIAPVPTPAPPVFVSPRPVMTNTPAPTPRPTPTPTPQRAVQSQTMTPQREVPWATIAGLLSPLLSPSLSRFTAPFSSAPVPMDPLTPIRPPFGDPLTPGLPNPFTPSMPTPSGLTPFNRPPLQSRTDQDRCRCKKCKEPKKRKKRKCLERAQLQWRSGRKKGQPAGSRCVRFATK